MFDNSTPVNESPETGHEEVTAEVEEQEVEQEQEVETAEVETETQEESDPNGHSEELLAGKYKTVEDLVNGYKSLEKFVGQRNQPNQQTQQPPVQPVQQLQETDVNELFWQELNQNPLTAVQNVVQTLLKEQLAPIQQQREAETLMKNFEPIAKEYRQFIKSEDDLSAYQQKVAEIAGEFGNPNLVRNPTQRVLRMAAQELWGNSNAGIIEKTRQDTRREIEQNRLQKQGISVQTSKKPQEKPKSAEEQIADSIVAAGTRNGIFG